MGKLAINTVHISKVVNFNIRNVQPKIVTLIIIDIGIKFTAFSGYIELQNIF